MEDQRFARLVQIRESILEEARAAAAKAVSILPGDLAVDEEPAHVYSADEVPVGDGESP